MPDPTLSVSLLLPEEAPLYQAVRHETFRPTINKILYAREPSQKTLDSVAAKTSDEIRTKGVLYLKCVDSATGAVVAGAKWRYMGHLSPSGAPLPRTLDEVKKELELPPPYEESDPAVFNAIFGLFAQNKLETMGTRPYYVLDTLVTHPEHHRRGAGGLLVKWGCDRADELGVEAFLEASLMGEPLYRRFGFVPVKEVGIDLRKFGGDEEMRFILMRRPAKGERA
ncbi:acyl-CoA N-acyltransferase [Melanomma pulvis-pyrius CBS 109.77]|uniref:Acyl-CoA N-acyltransferase n=1 Tax=Melanomma pulvis-pyrius CBS 109.77 TaxID=1314802 RepID=A0A6A6X6Z0_9PLEO|nr:acyl-CoA N-acyltransferase [Melanomma pulvis-pyrius CBS 109.77]